MASQTNDNLVQTILAVCETVMNAYLVTLEPVPCLRKIMSFNSELEHATWHIVEEQVQQLIAEKWGRVSITERAINMDGTAIHDSKIKLYLYLAIGREWRHCSCVRELAKKAYHSDAQVWSINNTWINIRAMFNGDYKLILLKNNKIIHIIDIRNAHFYSKVQDEKNRLLLDRFAFTDKTGDYIIKVKNANIKAVWVNKIQLVV